MDLSSSLYGFYDGWKKDKGFIGTTQKGALIPFFAVRKTEYPVILAQGAIHAREYITAYLLMLLARHFDAFGRFGTAYFIPAVNLDGVKIAERFDGSYKANANGVDLNVNFPARFGSGAKNVTFRGKENYIGKRPFSERETEALRDFTLSVRPDVTLSYHSKGEEIYWDFHQTGKRKEKDLKLAGIIADKTGYKVRPSGASAGGYKDWCIESLSIPAFTIEVGDDGLSHPIERKEVYSVFLKNREVIPAVTEYLWTQNLWNSR